MNDESKEREHSFEVLQRLLKPEIKDWAKQNRAYFELLEITKINQMTILEQQGLIEERIKPLGQENALNTHIEE